MVSRATNSDRNSGERSQPSEPMMPAEVLSEGAFQRLISLERKRSERSQRPFVLLLIDGGPSLSGEKNGRILLEMLAALQEATRETDVTGWYADERGDGGDVHRDRSG